MTYEPREDSELLKKQVRKYAFGKVLDVGTGSGIQAIEAGKRKKVKSVLAVDVDNLVIKELGNKKLKKIKIKKSDLFSKVKGKFHTIIFNPPYLPEDTENSAWRNSGIVNSEKHRIDYKGIDDKALYGGKKGYEVLERFLDSVNDYLTEKGIILVVFSSLTKKEKVDQIIDRNLLEFEELEKKHFFFEDLFVYKIWKNNTLRELNKKNVKKIKYFAHGKRGVIFMGKYNGKKIAVKVKRKESKAVERIKNEVKWLKVLNKKNIGPRLLFYGDNYLAYKFVEGEFILDYLRNKRDRKVLVSVLNQCFEMDKLGVNKEEMHRPVKHIIVNEEGEVTLLDFERCYKTKKPHNVTQFGVFLVRHKLANKKIISLLKSYKKEMNKSNLDKIAKLIKIK